VLKWLAAAAAVLAVALPLALILVVAVAADPGQALTDPADGPSVLALSTIPPGVSDRARGDLHAPILTPAALTSDPVFPVISQLRPRTLTGQRRRGIARMASSGRIAAS
jgi:hypothetical protein